MRGAHSSKWQEAMEDVMRQVPKLFWNIEKVPNGANTVGYNESTRLKYDSRRNMESRQARLVKKSLCKEKDKL